MKKSKIASRYFFSIILLLLFLSTSRSVFAIVVFEQSPPDDTYNAAILNKYQLLSFGCTLNLDCGASGQTIYNVGVWIKKIGNPADIRLQLANTWMDTYGGTSIFSNSVSANSISDTEYILKWFYFPSGVVLGNRYEYNQFFQFQFTDANGTFNPTDHYRVLQHDTNDFSANQQWCRVYDGCYTSKFFWKMDNSAVDLSIDTITTPTCCSNVLFIPGLEASRLYKLTNTGAEDQLWEPNGNSDVEDLYMNTDGTSINPNIYTRDIIKETNIPTPTGPAGQNIYKSFSEMMDGLVSDDKINRWESYAYDWRQGVQEIVDDGTPRASERLSLSAVLQTLVETSKNGKVTVVSHSNGGLIAKALLKKLEDDKVSGRNDLIDNVDALILVASPQLGTPSAIPALLHGYDQRILFGWLMDEVHARELGRNMSGAYGLLPSREYINRVSASPVTFVDNPIPSGATTVYVQNYGDAIDSYSEYKSFIFGSEGRTNPSSIQTDLPIKLSSTLFTQSENLHDAIDVWVPPADLRVIEVAGWGLDTIASFEYYPKYFCSSPSLGVGGCGYILDERPRFTSDGDKTVVVPSAQYMSSLGTAERYWVDLSEHNKQLFLGARRNREHKDILEVNQLNKLVSSVLGEKEIILDTVLKNSEPQNAKNLLRLSVHSPINIDAYDAEGNHTGKVCPTTSDFCYVEENILNSSYLEFGEGKYINLPEEEMSKVKLRGTGIGTFTYESEKVMPDGTATTSSFIDIPVTTQTQAEITLNATGTPQLKLDVTGDGISDFTLSPSTTFDPVTYLQIMKATIDSLDLNQGKKTDFTKRVDNIIKSIQKGKIDKAKLKVDRFKIALERKISKPDPKHLKPKKLSKTDAQLLFDMLNKLLDNLS